MSFPIYTKKCPDKREKSTGTGSRARKGIGKVSRPDSRPVFPFPFPV
jgi:hypothetical protein